MQWQVTGRDAHGHARHVEFDAQSEEAARAHVDALGWLSVDLLAPVIAGQVVRDDLAPLAIAPDNPALERARAEPEGGKRTLLSILATYRQTGWIGAAFFALFVASVGLEWSVWVSIPLGVILLVPAVLTVLGGASVQDYQDYRWAIARGDWPRAIECARSLQGTLHPTLARFLEARALAGAGHVEQARLLIDHLQPDDKCPPMEFWLHRSTVFAAAAEPDEELTALRKLHASSNDPSSTAQGLALHLAVHRVDLDEARALLAQAESIRGRGSAARLIMDMTRIVVLTEAGETEGLAELLDPTLRAAESAGHVTPEMHGLDAILHGYGALLWASTRTEMVSSHGTN